MKPFQKMILGLSLAAFLPSCSGMRTTMSRVGRLSENTGYEIPAELPMVQKATLAVLKQRGYAVSVKPDPSSGAEAAGQIVIGQRIVKYKAGAEAKMLESASSQMNTRDLVDVYLSKKWRVSDNQAVLNITLLTITGGSYLKKGKDGEEVETPLSAEFKTLLREEIERQVATSRRGGQG